MLVPQSSSRGSHKKVEWLCDCGRVSNLEVCRVVCGNTSSCGDCTVLSKSHFETTKYGKLRMRDPVDSKPKSKARVTWDCDCGKSTNARICHVHSGSVTSCGKCNTLDKEYFEVTKFKKLRMKHPISTKPGSGKKVEWLCDCGSSIVTSVYSVVSGRCSSCGKCNLLSKEYFEVTKFKKLRMKYPISIGSGSNKKVEWLCDCGLSMTASIQSVTSGRCSSCGRCHSTVSQWYINNVQLIRSLKIPITPEQIPAGGFSVSKPILRASEPFEAICGMCNNRYAPRWDNIRKGSSLTCGCTSNKTSGAQLAVFNFVKQFDFNSVLEHKVGKLRYDIFVPSRNLLIEYNGLKWHSSARSVVRDLAKYENALAHDFDILTLFDDEWIHNRKLTESVIGSYLTYDDSDQKITSDDLTYHSGGHQVRFTKENSWYHLHLDRFNIPFGVLQRILDTFLMKHRKPDVYIILDNRFPNHSSVEKFGFKLESVIPPIAYLTYADKRFLPTEVDKSVVRSYRTIYDFGGKLLKWSSSLTD